MVRTRPVPTTPITPSNISGGNRFELLTPHTPTSLPQTRQESTPFAFRTPSTTLQQTTLYTPPDSESRTTVANHVRRSYVPKLLTLDSWRKSQSHPSSGHAGRVSHQNDALLPPAFISTQRRRAHLSQTSSSKAYTGINRDNTSDSDSINSSESSSEMTTSDMEMETQLPDEEPRYGRAKGFVTDIGANFEANDASISSHESIPCIACKTSSSDLVTLSCAHVMCSNCFTSSLNIVGEKQFSCVSCSQPVVDFHFSKKFSRPQPYVRSSSETSKAHTSNNPRCSSDSAFAVLRLDDVPWDVTPNMLGRWADISPSQAHVLLDRDGKTLSHAYIEADTEAARAILLKCRNKVLGSGKRARRVTITFTSQEELMRQLFPSWRGAFANGRPTVSNIPASQVPDVVRRGLLSAIDLEDMTNLVFNPDSRYVKDPALPFYSLISLINKFPSDGDSRVFWSYATRDTLFALAYTAGTHLIMSGAADWKHDIVVSLVEAVMKNTIFTAEQMYNAHSLLDPDASASDSSFISTPSSSLKSHQPDEFFYAPPSNAATEFWTPYDSIARDLGVESHIVQAVCERLANCSLV